MIRLLAVIATAAVSACSALPPTTPPSPATPLPPSVREEATPPAREDKSAEQILAAFREDLLACTSLTRALKTDAAFIKSFQPEENRRQRSTADFLQRSASAQHPAVRHLLANQPYLELGVSLHGEPWAVSWVENEGIYCAPTMARLQEAEALGESAAAWEIRRFFLDKALQHLATPGDFISDGRVEPGKFDIMVAEAAQRYNGNQQEQFRVWAGTAIRALAQRRAQREGLRPAVVRENRNVLDRRIAFLRSIAGTSDTAGLIPTGSSGE